MVSRSSQGRTGTGPRHRAAAIRAVLTDCDGVLTDAGIYYSARGEELRRFSVRDGMGFERLRVEAGIPTCIITREDSPIVARRAEKLQAEVILGARDKLALAAGWAEARGFTLAEIAYLGDDVNDLPLLAAVGLSACPADAESGLHDTVDLVCSRPGGHGAFRELAEFILSARVPSVTPGPSTDKAPRVAPADVA
jgi:3-deoxy-D-manno-octulosonate 8-phosphate phosphatase (KDO 8-P phosphatase)